MTFQPLTQVILEKTCRSRWFMLLKWRLGSTFTLINLWIKINSWFFLKNASCFFYCQSFDWCWRSGVQKKPYDSTFKNIHIKTYCWKYFDDTSIVWGQVQFLFFFLKTISYKMHLMEKIFVSFYSYRLVHVWYLNVRLLCYTLSPELY